MKPNETIDAQGSILWTRPKLEQFKTVYRREIAVKKVAEYRSNIPDLARTFMFEGHEILTGYAKYLIQYLETILPLAEKHKVDLRTEAPTRTGNDNIINPPLGSA